MPDTRASGGWLKAAAPAVVTRQQSSLAPALPVLLLSAAAEPRPAPRSSLSAWTTIVLQHAASTMIVKMDAPVEQRGQLLLQAEVHPGHPVLPRQDVAHVPRVPHLEKSNMMMVCGI